MGRKKRPKGNCLTKLLSKTLTSLSERNSSEIETINAAKKEEGKQREKKATILSSPNTRAEFCFYIRLVDFMFVSKCHKIVNTYDIYFQDGSALSRIFVKVFFFLRSLRATNKLRLVQCCGFRYMVSRLSAFLIFSIFRLYFTKFF